MKEKKIITVFGATGAQGGSLANAILNDANSEFTIRAVTRNPQSEKAKALSALGAEVIQGDIDNPESIQAALDGAYGAFFVTFFWDHYSPERETKEAKILAEAASKAGLKHVIWSTLEDVRNYVPLENQEMPTLNKHYKVPHFDGKGEGDKFFKELGIPVTFLLASFYWENLIYFGMGPKRTAENKLTLTFPMGNKKMAGIGANDIGKCAYGIFKKGKAMVGKYVGIAGEHLTIEEMANAMSKHLGEEVVYNEISPEQYRGFGFPGADDLGNMFQFYRDFDTVCNESRDVNQSKSLNSELQSFDEWLAENARRLPLS